MASPGLRVPTKSRTEDDSYRAIQCFGRLGAAQLKLGTVEAIASCRQGRLRIEAYWAKQFSE
eukprot:4631326-Alexandrium_andersonii.AAC.1